MILLPFLLLLGCSAPSTVTITPSPGPNAKVISVVNQSSKIPDAAVAAWAQAINIQVERDFGMWRGTQEYVVEFGGHFNAAISSTPVAGAFSVVDIVDEGPWTTDLCRLCELGYHQRAFNNGYTFLVPEGTVSANGPYPSVTLSHEILEIIANYPPGMPQDSGNDEPCDDLGNASYQINGVDVADFKLPAWYHPGQSGPWDFTQQTTAAGQSLLR